MLFNNVDDRFNEKLKKKTNITEAIENYLEICFEYGKKDVNSAKELLR
jgi:hypothetical protein